MTRSALLEAILSGYSLPLHGSHGPSHWARVLENGRRLAPLTGADLEVVELFALLHDARRRNESVDPGHGRRAAEFAATLRGSCITLDDSRFELLSTACARHTDGMIEAEVTVQTCWDADRLDLGRVGFALDPRRLCTPAARAPDIRAWADARARARSLADLHRQGWDLTPSRDDPPA